MHSLGSTGPTSRTETAQLRWRPTKLTARVGTVGLVGLAAAVVFARPSLLLIATPSLLALAALLHGGDRPEQLRVTLELSEQRCFEGDDIGLRVRVEPATLLGEVSLSLGLPPALSVVGSPHEWRFHTGTVARDWTIRPQRWGRHRVGPVLISVRSTGLGWGATAAVTADAVTVFPPPLRARDLAVPPHLRAWLGIHVGRRPGSGLEFAGLREYVPGDAVRRVNWPVSSRVGSLMVNQYAVEHAADVVAFVDTTSDVRCDGSATLESAVRGAAGLAQVYLRAGDRVGVVGFGARLRWLAPHIGTRQYYRIMDHLLTSAVSTGFVAPELSRLPRPVLPSGCLVFLFSPLLDARVIDAVGDLRQRGHPVVVIDVLTGEPAANATPEQQLALRIWRLDRAAAMHGLGEMGAVVLPWDPAAGAAVERVRLQPLLGGAR